MMIAIKYGRAEQYWKTIKCVKSGLNDFPMPVMSVSYQKDWLTSNWLSQNMN